MNTDKTLTNVFCENEKYPIWYFKEIEETNIAYVIYNLLKETFIVEINKRKSRITFGKNRKHEIGTTQSCNEGLEFTSYETIEKAFREGKWFVITDKDTTEEFKEQYKIYEEERKKKEENKKNLVFDEFHQTYKTNFKIEKMIYKLRIAKELLKNTKNIHLSFFIEEYISNFNEIQSNNKKVLEELDLFEYIDFDRCIEYINQSKFDITGWCLWEIPLSNLYLFYNLSRKESFDLIVNDKNIIPAYIDENSNEIESNSIKEAIEKYIKE